MQYSPATPSVLLDTLNAKDSLLKSRLTEKITALNDEVLDRFKQQPTFSQFVQQAFNLAFTTLPAPVDVNSVFISIGPNSSSAAETLPVNNAQLSYEGALKPLLPTLIESVAARIASNQPTSYVDRTVSFHRSLQTAQEADLVLGITAQAFEQFLNRLANDVVTQFKEHVDRYWNGPISKTDVRTCKDWVAEKRLDIMKTEVELLKADGVLDTSSEWLLLTVIRTPDARSRSALPGHRPGVYGLAIKDKLSTDVTLYGAFVLTSRDQGALLQPEGDRPLPQARDMSPDTPVGGVLLYLPASGFEAFDSLANLDLELHRRLNSKSEFTDLLELVEERDRATVLAFHQQQIASGQFRYTERRESIFNHSVDALYQQVHAHFAWMVAHYQKNSEQLDSAQMPASLDRVTDLSRVFDTSHLLVARQRKRTQFKLLQFLKGASLGEKQEWEAAVRDYSDKLLEFSAPDGLPSLAQYSDRSTLLAYSNEQLSRVLEAEYGLIANPDEIIVHTKTYVTRQTGAYVTGGKPHPSEPGARVFDARTRTLTELALDNVGWLDLNFINFSRLTDVKQAPFTALSVTQVKELVRKVNIGDSYEQFLKERLVSGDAAKIEQLHYAQIMALQLRVDAIEAKIAGDFLPDRLNRGFNWVMSVLAGPLDDEKRPKVEEHRIIVSSLKLRGERVRGVLVFSTGSQSVRSQVVYTPQASGGRVFHEYVDAPSMHRDFINHSAWREYLIARVEVSARPRIRSVLKAGAGAAVIALSRIADNFLEEAYLIEASAAINEANAQSTSTQASNLDASHTIVTVALDLISMFLPIRIMLPIGLGRSILSVIDAVDAAQEGDRATAARSIVRAFAELLGAVIDGAIGAGRSGWKGTQRLASTALDPKLSLAKKPEGVTPLEGWEAHNLYVRHVAAQKDTLQAPQHFLLEKNHWYSIRRDSDTLVWRLIDPRRPNRAYKGDPLFRNSQGIWEIRSPGSRGEGLGLMGGAPTPTATERALMDLFPYLDQQQAQRVFDLFVFPLERARELETSLVHHLRTSLALPAEFHQYLLSTPQRFDALIRGQRLSSSLTPSPVEPVPGSSRSVRPPVPDRSPPPMEQRFLEWGQTLDPTTHRPPQDRPLFWRSSSADSGLGAPEYIQLGERHYATLPGGSAENGAVLVPNYRRYSTFSEFEDILHYNPFDQPRWVHYSKSLARWVISFITFHRPLVRYIEAAFPLFSAQTARHIGQALFINTNPTGLSTDGYARLLNTLRDWRSWPTRPSITRSDPLLLLSRHPLASNQNVWTLSARSEAFTLLEINTARIPGNLAAQAFLQQNDATTRTLMSTVLRSSGYEVFEVTALNHLIFRRRGLPTVYWLSLRRTQSTHLAHRNYIDPSPQRNSFQNLPPAIRAIASQAHAEGEFIPLIGVIQANRRTHVATPYIFKP